MDEVILSRIRQEAYEQGYQDGKVDGYNLAGAQISSAKQERKKGKWIKKMQITETTKYLSYNPRWYCNCCHTEYDPAIANEINFCWKCGADMRGEEDA